MLYTYELTDTYIKDKYIIIDYKKFHPLMNEKKLENTQIQFQQTMD